MSQRLPSLLTPRVSFTFEATSIDLSPMAHASDANDTNGICNLINYPVIPYPNSPVIVTTNQFPATRRTWIFLPTLRSIHKRDGELAEINDPSPFPPYAQ